MPNESDDFDRVSKIVKMQVEEGSLTIEQANDILRPYAVKLMDSIFRE